jgi:sec-independent protein translocase protein TatA
VGSIGPFQILIIAVVILILFGRGRISEMMGDFGKGVKSFRKGLNEDEEGGREPARSPARIEGPAHDAASTSETVESGRAADKTPG